MIFNLSTATKPQTRPKTPNVQAEAGTANVTSKLRSIFSIVAKEEEENPDDYFLQKLGMNSTITGSISILPTNMQITPIILPAAVTPLKS